MSARSQWVDLETCVAERRPQRTERAKLQDIQDQRRAQDIDCHIGARIRQRRIMLGLAQQQMAELIGVTYQQAHKYEKGINRISGGRLYMLAQALGVEVGYFYDGLGEGGSFKPTQQQRLLLDLARNFSALPSRRHQEAVWVWCVPWPMRSMFRRRGSTSMSPSRLLLPRDLAPAGRDGKLERDGCSRAEVVPIHLIADPCGGHVTRHHIASRAGMPARPMTSLVR